MTVHKEEFPKPYRCKIKTYHPDKQEWIQCSYGGSTQQNVAWHAYKSHFRDIYDSKGEYDCTVKYGYHLKKWAKSQEKKRKRKTNHKRKQQPKQQQKGRGR